MQEWRRAGMAGGAANAGSDSGARCLRRETRREPIDEPRRQVQRRDAEQRAVDTKERAQIAVDGAPAGIRELMQSPLRLQQPKRLLQNPETLLRREAQQRQAAD